MCVYVRACVCVCVCVCGVFRYRVVAPDLRGHGLTSATPDNDFSNKVTHTQAHTHTGTQVTHTQAHTGRESSETRVRRIMLHMCISVEPPVLCRVVATVRVCACVCVCVSCRQCQRT